MTCPHCGKEVPNSNLTCPYCAKTLRRTTVKKHYVHHESKTAMGVILGLFLGLIGLVIGLALYQGYERETFLKGWMIPFIIELVIGAIVCMVSCTEILALLSYY